MLYSGHFDPLDEDVVRTAARRAELTEAHGDGSARSVYNEFIAAEIAKIQRALDNIEELKALREHVHEWNDDDFCRYCGLDGRA